MLGKHSAKLKTQPPKLVGTKYSSIILLSRFFPKPWEGGRRQSTHFIDTDTATES